MKRTKTTERYKDNNEVGYKKLKEKILYMRNIGFSYNNIITVLKEVNINITKKELKRYINDFE